MPESNASEHEADGQPWQRRTVLRNLYVDQGKSQSEIADELGCTRSTVSRWLGMHDIETRERGSQKAHGETPWRDEETLRRLYIDEGKTSAEVGDILGCRGTTVVRWLRNHDIDVRERGGEQAPKHPKLSDGEWLRDQYHGKQRSTGDIAAELDVSPSNVRRWMDRAGIELHGQVLEYPELDDEETLRQWYEGEKLNTTQISDRIGCSQSAVVHHMDRLGIDRRSQDKLRGELSPRWKGGYSEERGTNWPKLRQRALEADNYQCQGCGRHEDDHRAEYGVGLHVHHIWPVTSFDNPSKADTVDNLVPLCRDCHHEWEGIPLRPSTV